MLGWKRCTIAFAASFVAGCFSEADPPSNVCEPGTQITCDCFKDDGVQVCRAAGNGFDPCQCPGDDDGTTTTSSGGDATGSTTTSQGSTTDESGGSTETGSSTSATTGSTTGDPDTTTGEPLSGIVINELVYDPERGDEDWIELYNLGDAAVEVSGWVISDGGNTFAIPEGTVIDPDAYLVYTRYDPGSFQWGFGDEEAVALYHVEGGLVDSTTWELGAAVEPYSLGRNPNGTGPFGTLQPTKGAPNE